MHMFIWHKHAYNWQMNALRKIDWIIFHGYITVSKLWGNLDLSYIVWNISVTGSFARTHDESSTESSHLFHSISLKCLFSFRLLELLISFFPQPATIPCYLLIVFTNRFHSVSSQYWEDWLTSSCWQPFWHTEERWKLRLTFISKVSLRAIINIYSQNNEKKVNQGLLSVSEKRNWQPEARIETGINWGFGVLFVFVGFVL